MSLFIVELLKDPDLVLTAAITVTVSGLVPCSPYLQVPQYTACPTKAGTTTARSFA